MKKKQNMENKIERFHNKSFFKKLISPVLKLNLAIALLIFLPIVTATPMNEGTDLYISGTTGNFVDYLEKKYSYYNNELVEYKGELSYLDDGIKFQYLGKNIEIEPILEIDNIDYRPSALAYNVNWQKEIKNENKKHIFDFGFTMPDVSSAILDSIKDTLVIKFNIKTDDKITIENPNLYIGINKLSFEDMLRDCEYKTVNYCIDGNCTYEVLDELTGKTTEQNYTKTISNCYSIDMQKIDDYNAIVSVTKNWSWFNSGDYVSLDPYFVDDSSSNWTAGILNNTKIIDGNLSLNSSLTAPATRHEYFLVSDGASVPYTYGVYWRAQAFTVGTIGENENLSITKVVLKMFRVGNPGTLTVSIKAVSGGLPTGDDLASGTINANTFTDNSAGAWYDITLSSYTLQASTSYAVAVRALSGDSSNNVRWHVNNSGTYTGGDYSTSSDNGNSWTISEGRDFLFEVWGSGPIYTSSGTFTSQVFNAGSSVSWDNLTRKSNEPTGTDITFKVRSCNDNNCNGESWSNTMTYPLVLNTTITPDNQYFQYQAILQTTNTTFTPYLEWVNISYTGAPTGPSVTTTLTNPQDQSIDEDGTITFECSATATNSVLVNMTLYYNVSGTFSPYQTQPLSGTQDSETFGVTLADGTNILWNCLAYNNATNSSFASNNWTVRISLPPPEGDATLLSLQGKVTNSTNGLVDDADLTAVVVNTNDCNAGGNNLIYNHTFTNEIQNGIFSVLLGSTENLILEYNKDYYMCTYVDNELVGSAQRFRGGQGEIGGEDIEDNVNLNNVTLGTTSVPTKMQMFTPAGNPVCCGPDNSYNWICSSGYC